MTMLETTQTVPLTLTEDGMTRTTGSRVSLDSIIHHFKPGPLLHTREAVWQQKSR
jgi:hypothetical protein